MHEECPPSGALACDHMTIFFLMPIGLGPHVPHDHILLYAHWLVNHMTIFFFMPSSYRSTATFARASWSALALQLLFPIHRHLRGQAVGHTLHISCMQLQSHSVTQTQSQRAGRSSHLSPVQPPWASQCRCPGQLLAWPPYMHNRLLCLACMPIAESACSPSSHWCPATH